MAARGRFKAGMSLVEVAVAGILLAVAAIALAGALGSSSLAHGQSRSTAIAMAALRDKVAELQAYADSNMAGLLAHYTTAGDEFDVPPLANVHGGLAPVPGKAHVGAVYCFKDETGAAVPPGAVAADATRVGLPRDINMDDDAGDISVATTDVRVLPVKVAVEFLDLTGPRRLELFVLVAPQR